MAILSTRAMRKLWRTIFSCHISLEFAYPMVGSRCVLINSSSLNADFRVVIVKLQAPLKYRRYSQKVFSNSCKSSSVFVLWRPVIHPGVCRCNWLDYRILLSAGIGQIPISTYQILLMLIQRYTYGLQTSVSSKSLRAYRWHTPGRANVFSTNPMEVLCPKRCKKTGTPIL